MQLYWIRIFPAFIFIISLYHLPCVCIIIIYISMSPLFSFFSLFTFLSILFFENSRMAEPCTAMVCTLLNVKSLAAVVLNCHLLSIYIHISLQSLQVAIVTVKYVHCRLFLLQAIPPPVLPCCRLPEGKNRSNCCSHTRDWNLVLNPSKICLFAFCLC